jgi:hypothetical protein
MSRGTKGFIDLQDLESEAHYHHRSGRLPGECLPLIERAVSLMQTARNSHCLSHQQALALEQGEVELSPERARRIAKRQCENSGIVYR